MDKKRKIKLVNHLHNGILLIYEITPLKEGYRTWFVIKQSEAPEYSFKIRKESFSIYDIVKDYDIIGKHEFSDYIFLSTIEEVDNFLHDYNLIFEEFIESWNTDYPL